MITKVQKNDADVRNKKFEQMLPQIRAQARVAFRGEPPELRSELIAEVIANAFVALVRLVERDCTSLVYPTPLTQYAIKQVRSGRRVGTKMNSNDISSEYAQQKRGITVERLDRFNQRDGWWNEILVEDRTATPADLAASRIDFGDWLGSLTVRQRRIATTLAEGDRTKEVARQFSISSGRVSQLRRELSDSWHAFHGDVDDCTDNCDVDVDAFNRSLAIHGEVVV